MADEIKCEDCGKPTTKSRTKCDDCLKVMLNKILKGKTKEEVKVLAQTAADFYAKKEQEEKEDEE